MNTYLVQQLPYSIEHVYVQVYVHISINCSHCEDQVKLFGLVTCEWYYYYILNI